MAYDFGEWDRDDELGVGSGDNESERIAERMSFRTLVMEHRRVHPLGNPRRVHAFLSQTDIWLDRFFVQHRIDELDEGYTFNILKFLRDRADAVRFAFEVNLLTEAAEVREKLINHERRTPEEWIGDSPLYRSLVRHLAELMKPDESVRW